MANSQEYGLFQLIDLGLLNPFQTARTVDSGLLTSAIQYDVNTHNSDLNALLGTFCTTTSEIQEGFRQQSTSRNQPLDENGRTIPIKAGGVYSIGYPIIGSGNALGHNYVTSVQMTVQTLARTIQAMYRGDYNWVRDHVLGTLFDNVGYDFVDPVNNSTLHVKGLANGDAVSYYRTTGAAGTDTHYLAQAAAIDDAHNPFQAIVDELREHPDNGQTVVVFVATSLVSSIQGLAEFYAAGTDPDFSQPTDTTRLTGSLGIVLPPNAEVKGKTESGAWIVEWRDLPAGYMLAITTEGAKPLAKRVYPQSELQGFKPAGTREDWPYFETQWIRFEGYGGRNRAGAVVYQVGAADYVVPTGYAVPMP